MAVRDWRDALLSPRAVAIVGQSNDAAKTAGRPLHYLRRAGFAGRIYPVNDRRAEVLGERAWPSLAALPEVPEHVYIVTPTEAAIDAAAECGRLGVKVATILADGFSEAGPAGATRVARLQDICAETGLRIVGPSSLGVVDLRQKLLLTANAAFAETDLPAGKFFAASHSGSMIGALVSRGLARHVHFAGLVACGNEIDLSVGEICAATLDDPGIDGYMLFLETLRHADALRAFAVAAAARGKPIVAYKLGRSAEARELAVTHTGALAGEDDVADAFLADCGIARVDTLEGLIEALPLVARLPIRAAGERAVSVGVVTTTGGGATTVVDPLAARGVRIAPPSAATQQRFAKAGIKIAPARLIDLTIAGTRPDVMKAALDIMATAPEFDLLLAVVGSSARFHPELAVRPIIDSAGAAKPIAAFLVPDAPHALARLAAAGVPSFATPEACADAIAAALKRRMPKPLLERLVDSAPNTARLPLPIGERVEVRKHRTGREGSPPSPGALRASTSPRRGEVKERLLDELESFALLDRLGIARAPAVVLDASIEGAPVLPFAYPVAVKILSAEIAHKTDLGGVVLDVTDDAGLLAAIHRIKANVTKANPQARAERVLVQQMIRGVGEVLIGYRVDADVGPLIMVAAGGIFTEVYRDRSLRLAPVELAAAREMVAEVKAFRALAGFRGRPAGDLDALAQAVVHLSDLAARAEPTVLEAEVNPLIVRPAGEGVVAVDALVRLA